MNVDLACIEEHQIHIHALPRSGRGGPARVQGAIDRGEIPADTDADVVLDLLSARPTTACCRATGR